MQRPLENVTVTDFSWSVAGPTVTRVLASLGAEVLKVEWPTHSDPMRKTAFPPGEVPTIDNGTFFSTVNVGKRSITLDMRKEAGREVARDLIARSDVVVESFSSGVFEKWGLTHETLDRLSPGIVYLSISGFGHSGRYKNYGTWGPTAQAFNGATHMSGLPGEPPAGWGWSYMDLMAGYTGALAVLMALHHRSRSGAGQYIDVSQVETGIALNGVALLDFTVNGRPARRASFPTGNRSHQAGEYGYRGEIGAPYNIYPTRGGGPNDYCAITVLNDAQWDLLKTALGKPDWANDAQFATMSGRLAHQDELDRRIAEWTSSRGKYEVMRLLQARGVPCGAVQSAEDRLEHDPQLRSRGLYEALEHPVLGRHRYEGLPIHFQTSDTGLRAIWPLLGRDTEEVFRELLGYPAERIEQLRSSGVTWPASAPESMLVARALW